jgi:nickel/cobalt exporter
MKRLLLMLGLGCLAGGHPMGNFSVNHYTSIETGVAGVGVTYILELGEVPAYTVLQSGKSADQLAREWAAGLEFRSGERRLEPRVVRAELKAADGSGGLRTARFTMRMTVDGADGSLRFEDRNFPERGGWKEIVIRAGAGASIVRASQAGTDRSSGLTNYPGDPPRDLRAMVEWRAGEGMAPAIILPIEQPKPVSESAPAAPAEPAKTDYLASLLGRKQISMGLVLAGMAVAFGLGAVHGLSPGHGKTIVAAYLVGSRGTMKHAAILGATVTFTHTASVFALGLATLFLSEYVAPQKIAPVLGVISGVSIVAVGGWLLFTRWKALRHALQHERHDAHAHSHHELHHHEHGDPETAGIATHEHSHSHHELHHHEHGDPETAGKTTHGHSHLPEGDITMGSLLALGASGGLVPCPSALVLLLSSVALGHVALGMTLLVAFSLGLAGVLMGIGMMVLYARRWLPDPAAAGRHAVLRWTPVASAGVIVVVGVVMTVSAAGVGRG